MITIKATFHSLQCNTMKVAIGKEMRPVQATYKKEKREGDKQIARKN